MKKVLVLLLAVIMIVGITACGSEKVVVYVTADPNGNYPEIKDIVNETEAPDEKTSIPTTNTADISANSFDELKKMMKADYELFAGGVKKEYDDIKGKITTVADYQKYADALHDIYKDIVNKTEEFCNRARKYAACYAEIILKEDGDHSDKYRDNDEIYDEIYNGILDDAMDDIYNGIFDDAMDDFYNGVLEDASDELPYKDASKLTSSEYKACSRASSDSYKIISDASSDVYRFASDFGSALFQNDMEDAEKELKDFLEDIK